MNSGFKRFGVEIERQLDKEAIGLPDSSMTSHFRLENHQYETLRACWREAKVALALENSLLTRLQNADDLEAEHLLVSDEMYEDIDQPLRGLDLGVAAAVLALSAMGCVTITSCNGGFLNDSHHEEHPLVVFYAEPDHTEFLLKAAAAAGVGISNGGGAITVWANDIWDMHKFARELVDNSPVMRKRKRSA
jgi:hypothetical protein